MFVIEQARVSMFYKQINKPLLSDDDSINYYCYKLTNHS